MGRKARVDAVLDAAGIARIDEGALIGAGRTVPYVLIPGAAALDGWRALRRRAVELEMWPLILGPPGELELLEEGMQGCPTIDAVLREAEALADDWPTLVPADGAIPGDAEPREGFTIPYDRATGAPHRIVALAWTAAAHPWEVPAHLAWGGRGDNPPPARHVAALRRWHERYRALPVGMTADELELLVDQPPDDDSGALALAREHCSYCPAAGEAGLASLAGDLRRARTWSFAWR